MRAVNSLESSSSFGCMGSSAGAAQPIWRPTTGGLVDGLHGGDDPIHLLADLGVKGIGLVRRKHAAGLCQRPIARVIFPGFPFVVWAAIHELWKEEIAHVLASVLLCQEVAA